MSPMKKVCLLAMVMILFFIPVVSGSVAGFQLSDGNIRETRGFDDRSAGTLHILLENDSSADIVVNVTVRDNLNHAHVYAVMNNITVPYTDSVDVGISFQIGTPGQYWIRVDVTDALTGDPLSEWSTNTIMITVNQSIWSNTWTYIAIIVVIIIVAIGAFIKMRSNPKVEESGAFTAMEEERKAGKKGSGTKREEYKGRRR
jgi:hypothetical protein